MDSVWTDLYTILFIYGTIRAWKIARSRASSGSAWCTGPQRYVTCHVLLMPSWFLLLGVRVSTDFSENGRAGLDSRFYILMDTSVTMRIVCEVKTKTTKFGTDARFLTVRRLLLVRTYRSATKRNRVLSTNQHQRPKYKNVVGTDA